MMGYIDSVLIDFKGQLRYSEILQMTYKEIGYLKKHRIEYYKQKAKNANLGDAIEEMAGM